MCSLLLRSRSTRTTVLALFALLVLLVPPGPARAVGAVIYVNAAAARSGDGSSWAKPFRHLQDALAAAQAGDEIWVAAGTYRPTIGADRSANFYLKRDVPVYGGFIYGMTSRDQRDWRAHPTILSGDLLSNDGPNFANYGDNSYNVVRIEAHYEDTSMTLDGFTITGGNGSADILSQEAGGAGIGIWETSPTLRNLIIIGNRSTYGGGILIFGYDASPILSSVTISGNQAVTGGGIGISNSGALTMTNVVISANSAETEGGGIWGSSGTMTNVTISGNQAGTSGGGIWGSSGTMTNVTISGNQAGTSGGGVSQINNLTIANSIVWGNTAPDSPQFVSGTPSITSSIVQGGYAGAGNRDADPQFGTAVPAAPSTGGDLHLKPASPAINAGDNTGIDPASTDSDGRPRIIGATVDMGAYEAPPGVVSITRASPSPLQDATAPFTVTFNMPVSNVTAAAFAVNATGGQAKASVGNVTGSGMIWNVAVNTVIDLGGTIRLDLEDTDTITAAPDVPLGGAGAGNGSFAAGEVYAVGSTGFTTYLALAKR
jgi:hypothetical protein